MKKKLLKLLKITVTGIIWTYIYAGLASYITVYFWKFNILSAKNWNIIAKYWDSGNAIASTSDFMFFFTLFLLFIIWLLGLTSLSKQNYVKILFFPIVLYNDYISSRYGNDSPRIILKNMGTMQNQDLSQLVEQQLAKEKPQKTTKVDIRSSIKKKIESANK